MKKVFVSGCYDILHAGHLHFFEDAKSLGDHLTVCFASKDVLVLSKGRVSALPDSHKAALIGSLRCVDRVVTSTHLDPVFDFIGHWDIDPPQILAVTEDDSNVEKKREVCKKYNVELIVLPKKVKIEKVSTTSILAHLKNLTEVPLRVDFAGGWLDVPSLSKKDAFIVNCAISPLVSLSRWSYEKNAGLGGSAAYALLKIKDGVSSELNLGVGWQDPAIINETGLCVWRSGKKPNLEAKYNPDWLSGKMLIVWSGSSHDTPNLMRIKRNYTLIKEAGICAAKAANTKDLRLLAKAIHMSYEAQINEGMGPVQRLPAGSPKHLAQKYCGGGHGGYILYLFKNKTDRDAAHKKATAKKIKSIKIEPYIDQY